MVIEKWIDHVMDWSRDSIGHMTSVLGHVEQKQEIPWLNLNPRLGRLALGSI